MMPKNRFIFRFGLGIMLAILTGLLFLAPVSLQAQTPLVQATLTTAVRYNTGVTFSLKATYQGKLEKAELRFHPGKNAPEYTKPSDKFNPGSTITTQTSLQVSTDDLAAGMPISYYWLLTTDKGQSIATESKQVIYEDTRFTWREAAGATVTMRWYKGDDRYGQQMYNLASDTLNTLKKRFAFQTNEQMYVSIYATKQEFFEIAPQNTPSWAGGVAFLERNEIILIAPQDSYASVRVGEGVPHEVAHLALYQTVRRQLPRWFDEGFAVYNQNIKSEDYYRIAKDAHRRNSLLDFSQLVYSFPASSEGANLAYAQGASFVDFLVVRYGDKVMANLFDQLRNKDLEEAMQATFGVGQSELTNQWYNYLQGKPVSLPAPLKTGPVAGQASGSSSNSGSPRLVEQSGTATEGGIPKFEIPDLTNYLVAGVIIIICFVAVYIMMAVGAGRRKRLSKATEETTPVYRNNLQAKPAPSFLHDVYSPSEPGTSDEPLVTPLPPLVTPPPPHSEADPLDFILAQFGKPSPKDKNQQ